MLELDDIQHFLISRTPALAARYEFLNFPSPTDCRAWLSGVLEKVGSASTVSAGQPDSRWVTVAFTWNGLRAMGLDGDCLASFPEEFRLGMAARAAVNGTTGRNAPDNWL